MMRAGIVIGVFALAACGSGEETTKFGDATFTNNEEAGTSTIETPEGSVSTAEGAAAAKTAMPDYAPRYPGSTITSSVMSAKKGEGKQTVITFTTKDDPSKVAAFYKEKFTAGGLVMQTDLITAEGGMMAAENDKQRAALTTSKDEAESEISAVLIFGDK